MDQKCNIATRELDELRERLQRDQEEAQINYDNLRVSENIQIEPTLRPMDSSDNVALCVYSVQAVVQEADQRLAELKKATYEFDRDVLRGSVNPV